MERYLLTDTHCHLNDEVFAGRVDTAIAAAEAVGVVQMIVPGWDQESSRRALALAADYPSTRPAVGQHPWFITPGDNLDWLPGLLDDPRVVAMGEIGLDGRETDDEAPGQEALFRRQLLLARERDLPVLIHCRRGWDRLLRCLRDTRGTRGIIHAYSGSREILRECLHLGFYISFAGMVTRPHSYRAHEAAMQVPADRLLLETDAPCMTLDGVAAGQSAPVHLPQVLHYIAHLRGIDATALASRIAQNVKDLFGEFSVP